MDTLGYFDLPRARSMFGNEQGLRKIMRMAVQSLPDDMTAIATSLSRADREQASRRLHAVKGFVPIFCTPALANQIATVERLCKSADCAEIGVAYAQIAPALQSLCQELAVYLASPGAEPAAH